MKPVEIAEGIFNSIDVINYLKGHSEICIKDFLDDMLAESIVLPMMAGNTPANIIKTNRLRKVVDLVCEELMPDYELKRTFHIPKNGALPKLVVSQRCKKTTQKRGRPVKPLQTKVIGNDNGELIQKLHIIAEGKKGKDFCLFLVACIVAGKMVKPTYNQADSEFGDIGSRQNFNRYIDKRKYSDDEIECAKKALGLS